MDIDKINRRHSLKIIISESIMVLAVILTVIVLALVVSGYWVNSDFEVERQGMLQISSVPTGANVIIDDESAWLQRTNTSKVLSSGEHTVRLEKEGYDSWAKTINIREGLLYRLHYPRLFWANRTPENTLDITGATFATMSPDHSSLLLTNSSTDWSYVDLRSEKIKSKTIGISEYFSTTNVAPNATTGLFTGKIMSADWDYDGAHVLFRVKSENSVEWVLLDVKNVANSINLTKEFGGDFTKVQILDNSANHILVVKDGNLHRIDVPGKQLSAVLVKDIINFDHYENEVVFTASRPKQQSQPQSEPQYYIGYFRAGDKPTELKSVKTPPRVLISKFYDQKYLTTITERHVVIRTLKDLASYADYELEFTPDKAEVGHNGEFLIMTHENQIATIDMEANQLRTWSVDGDDFAWIDNDMIYSVSDGQLIVYDFDGLNRRIIATNASSHLPAGITENKWLYYFSDDHLMREWIVER